MVVTTLAEEYEALTAGCGLVRLPRRTLLEVSGQDRKNFLHNFCTADVNGLGDNASTEAFVLNGKGKVLGHVLLISLPDRLLISGVGDQAAVLVEHLDRYIIRDDVVITDRSAESNSLFVCGNEAGTQFLEISNVQFEIESAAQVTISDVNCYVARAEVAGDGLLVIASASQIDHVAQAFVEKGAELCSLAALEIVRIQNGTPWFGQEIDDSNLPQELDRDAKAISFTKGCYLGQETVARIDSLGHVNRLLRRLSIKTDSVPEIGSEVFAGDTVVGQMLSATRAPASGGCLALAFLKRTASDAGKELKVAGYDAVVL